MEGNAALLNPGPTEMASSGPLGVSVTCRGDPGVLAAQRCNWRLDRNE